MVNEPSKAELLEEIEVLKFQLAQAKRQLKKKSYQSELAIMAAIESND